MCEKVRDNLAKKGINVRVVSMPCVEVFDKQRKSYKDKVLDRTKPIICVEASSDNVWHKYAQREEYVFTLKTFGESGKLEDVCKHFGLEENYLTKYVEKVIFS